MLFDINLILYISIKSAIIGSREQLCVDEYVKGIQNKNSKVNLLDLLMILLSVL